jgi:hypothetical protein
MDNADLKALGTILHRAMAGLIVLYETNMADQVAANIKGEKQVRL